MIVYILFHETNTGHSDDSNGYVEAVYATETLAEAARLAYIRQAIDDGRKVYLLRGPSDWTDDWRVEAHEVLEEATLPDQLQLRPAELP